MPEYTDNLKLFKYNTATDGKEVFSINEAMNYNWDILDKQPGTLKTNQITNCLTEVPQRINVGLNNGALTLKAGSVVIVPYGTSAPTFEVGDPLNGGEIVDISWDGQKLFYFVKYDEDLTSTFNIGDYDLIPQVNNDKTINTTVTDACYSGASEPTADFDDATWYDTTENVVKGTNDHGSTWITAYSSLPFCFAKATSAGYSSIETVFNGFGFMGSTIWVDKGVKGLAPDGRNADGSLKNYEITVENIVTRQTTFNGQLYLQLQYNNVLALSLTNTLFFNYDDSFDDLSTLVYFDSVNNIVWTKTNNVWAKTPRIIINLIKVEDLKVTSFEPAKQPFRAVDYNDTGFMAHQAMPSDKYEDLTAGVSGSTYTAPADGYYYILGISSTANRGWVALANLNINNFGIKSAVADGPYTAICYMPCKKGDILQIGHSKVSITKFMFIYAQGVAND